MMAPELVMKNKTTLARSENMNKKLMLKKPLNNYSCTGNARRDEVALNHVLRQTRAANVTLIRSLRPGSAESEKAS